ncbi:hypothetical protein PPERSA_06275 [Pseudocohnilembus persalinus]|uniref:Polycystin cation channel PKD1/PKD2 domain-containing protein n=1 Tax=Pseudocohnilembus persalinus TaxID=266149 RepID=A0A0V0QWB5_PSEPJ|nr:hypothetical protein PPERSA_06275 [Pseudocohnilembus persalinus]|eukprot:KRX06304.1 hypothetical protein PPERSA_06275 [Pseudocohnilembus persalinus]
MQPNREIENQLIQKINKQVKWAQDFQPSSSEQLIELQAISYQNKHKNLQNGGIQIDQKVIDKMTMSPVSKYQIYDNFPCKIITHILLCLFTSLQILLGEVSDNNVQKIFTVQEFQNQLSNMFENIQNYNQVSFQEVSIEDITGNISFEYNYPMEFANIQNFPIPINKQFSFPFNLNEGIIEPFDMRSVKEIKKFLKYVNKFNINISYIKTFEQQEDTCWSANIRYDIVAQTVIEAVVFTSIIDCPGETHKENIEDDFKSYGTSYFLSIIILILASFAMFLNFKYVFDVISVYKFTKHQNQYPVFNPRRNLKRRYLTKTDKEITIQQVLQSGKPWNLLTKEEKKVFFDTWFVYTLIGNFFQIASTSGIFFVQNHDPYSQFYSWILGLSCFFAWTNMIKYLKYHNSINIVMNVIGNAFPRILQEAVGFIPILMFYITIGITFFSQSNRFINFDFALCTLFALLLGDSVNDIAQDLKMNSTSGLIGVLYVISFCFVFMLAVHNIWIAMIMEELKVKKNRERKQEEEKKLKQMPQKFVPANQSQLRESVVQERETEYDFEQEDFNLEIERKIQENNQKFISEMYSPPNVQIDQQQQQQQQQQQHKIEKKTSAQSFSSEEEHKEDRKQQHSALDKISEQDELDSQQQQQQQQQLPNQGQNYLNKYIVLKDILRARGESNASLESGGGNQPGSLNTYNDRESHQSLENKDFGTKRKFSANTKFKFANLAEKAVQLNKQEDHNIKLKDEIRFLLQDTENELLSVQTYHVNQDQLKELEQKYRKYMKYLQLKLNRINSHLQNNLALLKLRDHQQ